MNEGDVHNDPDEKIRNIYNRLMETVDMQQPYIVHGVKATLDELNYLTYKAKQTLAEELKTDADLQHFFNHMYPGSTIPIYKDLFGNPENAIVRKRFTSEIQCTNEDEGEAVISILDRFNKDTEHTIEGIPKPPGEPISPGRPPLPPGLPTYKGIPLTRDKRFFIQGIN